MSKPAKISTLVRRDSTLICPRCRHHLTELWSTNMGRCRTLDCTHCGFFHHFISTGPIHTSAPSPPSAGTPPPASTKPAYLLTPNAPAGTHPLPPWETTCYAKTLDRARFAAHWFADQLEIPIALYCSHENEIFIIHPATHIPRKDLGET